MLESLSDYFGRHKSAKWNRVFIAYKMAALLKREFNQEIRVVIKPAQISLICQDQALAVSLKLKYRRLHQLLKPLLPKDQKNLPIRIRVKPN